MQSEIIIAEAIESDFDEIAKIYSHYVENTTVSLEELPPSAAELVLRWRGVKEKSLPYLVAKSGGKVVGYAYAVPYRTRSAYRFTVEESVYVSQNFQGQGVGRRLLNELIRICQNAGYRQMLAVIAGHDNTASINFHESLGFEKAGVLRNFGFKFGGWVDTILMQKSL